MAVRAYPEWSQTTPAEGSSVRYTLATLVVRPEQVEGHPTILDGPSVIAIKATEAIFEGAALWYELIDDQGQVHTALTAADSTTAGAAPSDNGWMASLLGHAHRVVKDAEA